MGYFLRKSFHSSINHWISELCLEYQELCMSILCVCVCVLTDRWLPSANSYTFAPPPHLPLKVACSTKYVNENQPPQNAQEENVLCFWSQCWVTLIEEQTTQRKQNREREREHTHTQIYTNTFVSNYWFCSPIFWRKGSLNVAQMCISCSTSMCYINIYCNAKQYCLTYFIKT